MEEMSEGSVAQLRPALSDVRRTEVGWERIGSSVCLTGEMFDIASAGWSGEGGRNADWVVEEKAAIAGRVLRLIGPGAQTSAERR